MCFFYSIQTSRNLFHGNQIVPACEHNLSSRNLQVRRPIFNSLMPAPVIAHFPSWFPKGWGSYIAG